VSTTTTGPLISVCIPAYNRAALLPELLDSILAQDCDDYEILISEDCSPERDSIRRIGCTYASTHPGRFRYHENDNNVGYDGNLRKLIELARGGFCLFMGNDDLMPPHALAAVATALRLHADVGVVLRSYAIFSGTPSGIVEICRYFDRQLVFPPGAKTIATVYRRAVVISGIVVHREAALRCATDRFDGTLLYQLHLVANILADKKAVYLPDLIALYRTGGVPEFGNSPAEQPNFKPREQTIESSIHFVRGMLAIAKHVQAQRNLPIYRPILRDIANYSYPILAIQAQRSLSAFVKYGWALARMGLGRHFMFYMWLLALILVGPTRLQHLIRRLKQMLGHTPSLGDIYRGDAPNPAARDNAHTTVPEHSPPRHST